MEAIEQGRVLLAAPAGEYVTWVRPWGDAYERAPDDQPGGPFISQLGGTEPDAGI